MSFPQAVATCFSKYVEFGGRAKRSEYWWWVLFCFLAAMALTFVSQTVSGLFGVATFLPSLAVTVRRLHDTGRSGWWILIGFVPVVGWLVMLYFMVQDSK